MFALSLFSDDAPSANSPPRSEDSISIVSDGATIEGTLEFSSVDLRIEGTVHGDISTDGRVVVSKGAEVHGTVEAHTIRLAGYAEGRLRAEEELILCPPSEVNATLRADILQIQPGADFTGEVPGGEQETAKDPESSVPEQNGADLPVGVTTPENGNSEVSRAE